MYKKKVRDGEFFVLIERVFILPSYLIEFAVGEFTVKPPHTAFDDVYLTATDRSYFELRYFTTGISPHKI